MLKSDLYIGLISGTSVDGVDCVLVSFAGDKPVLIASYFEESSTELRERILTLCEGNIIELPMLGETDVVVGKWFACLLYTSQSPRDATLSRMASSG